MRSKIFQKILDETPKDVEIFVRLYSDIVLRVNQLLREKGLSQKALADKLDKKPSEINKWLSGDHNFTLRSIAKLEAELDEIILYVPKRISQIRFEDGNSKTYHMVVLKNIYKGLKNETFEWQSTQQLANG